MSNEIFIGWIAKLASREAKYGKKAFSAKVLKEDGTEYNQWFRFGFLDSSPVSEGDHVKLVASEVTEKYVTVTDIKKGSKPMPTSKGVGSGSDSSGSYQKNDYNTSDAATQRAYHAARGTAVDLVKACLEANAFPLPATNQKAGKAKAYEEVLQAVDKLTVRMFRDVVSGEIEGYRVLKSVQDEGDLKGKDPGNLPDNPEDDDDFQDNSSDGFPAEDDDGFV